MTGKEFTRAERKYLERLDAVSRVTATRIYYKDTFRDESMRRYLLGDSPVEIFRDAGLDPSLIGHKRIERCFSRWREQGGADNEETGGGCTRRCSSRHNYMRDAIEERDRFIARQALRIDDLESQVAMLRRRLQECSSG